MKMMLSDHNTIKCKIIKTHSMCPYIKNLEHVSNTNTMFYRKNLYQYMCNIFMSVTHIWNAILEKWKLSFT